MNQEKIGKFIANCRKNKNFTQEQLAYKLGVTDKSVSKWERGKSLPDISLFEQLCKELGITLNELFAGEYILDDEMKMKTDRNLRISMHFNQFNKERILLFFGLFCLISMFVCTIVDFVLMNSLTWSMIVNGSIVFVYSCLSISLRAQRNKLFKTLLLINILIFPLLFLIEYVVNCNYLSSPINWFIPIAVPIVIIWSVFIWVLFLIKKYAKINIWNWFGILFLLSIFLNVGMNIILEPTVAEYRWLDVDNIINITASLLCAIGCFYIGIFKAKVQIHFKRR